MCSQKSEQAQSQGFFASRCAQRSTRFNVVPDSEVANAPHNFTLLIERTVGDAEATCAGFEERFSFVTGERIDVNALPTPWLLVNDVDAPSEDALPSDGDCAAVVADWRCRSTDVAPESACDASCGRCRS